MRCGSLWVWITVLCALLSLAGCSGGGNDDTTPNPGEKFSLILTANPPVGNVGPTGLTVSFFVVASGGIAPYTYSWDVNGDNTPDLTAASGQWIFTEPGAYNVKVTVKDDNGLGDTVTATRLVTVNDDTSGPAADNLIVRFNATPQNGDLGFTCRFQSAISGGKEPYKYEWDFDCDLREWMDPVTGIVQPPTTQGAVPSTFLPDAFLQHPSWTYDQIGPMSSDNPPNYTVFPVLRVTDGTGKVATNLDDIVDNYNSALYEPDGLPDFNLGINVMPLGGGLTVAASANPMMGQAPLVVEFIGSVTGGSGQYQFKWNFGEGGETGWSDSSMASHTYLNIGDYSAFVTVRDKVSGQQAVTSPLLIRATFEQSFNLIIKSDVGSHPGGYFDEHGETDGFGIPAGVKGNVTEGNLLWNTNYAWNLDPPEMSGTGRTCTECHADNNVADITGRSFQQIAAVVRGTTHGTTGQEEMAPNGTDMTDEQIADIVAFANAGQGFEYFEAEVPFVVGFGAYPENGMEPITYKWDVFDEIGTAGELPEIATPPGLDSTAVVTPDQSERKNPTIHFASTGIDTNDPTFPRLATKAFAVRCVARDAAGNEAVSNIIRVTANRHAANAYYFAHRPFVEYETYCPMQDDGNPMASANTISLMPASGTWSVRANAAVCSHPTGISYVLGGEILDETGAFVRLVDRGDSAYMYIPETVATGTFETAIGKFNTLAGSPSDTAGRGGAMVKLTDGTLPAFPNTPVMGGPGTGYPSGDTVVPPQLEPDEDPAQAPPTPAQRSAPFTIVGSAAAVMMHEAPQTNPPGLFPHMPPVPTDDIDEDIMGLPNLYAWPDSPQTGWNLDAPPMPSDGLGCPVIYVIGGRTGAHEPTDLVQKYLVFGYGSEDLIPYSETFGFQTTSNQTDIWAPYYLIPDTDQFTGPNSNFDPEIDNRSPGDEQTNLPRLPVPLYGLMAVKVETGIDTAAPTFPYGTFSNIFIFGGIDQYGAVRDEVRWWNIGITSDPSDDETTEGVFSLIPDAAMPTPRAYGKAIFIPTNPFRVALVGGINAQGVPVDTIDIFTFGSNFNPSGGGSWETFAGTLPEALEACGAGYSSTGETSESWVLAFGGWTGGEFNYRTYNARTRSDGNLVVNQAPVVVPRSNTASSQTYSTSGTTYALSPLVQEIYYLFGGTDENGVDSIVEVFGLP